MGKIFYQENKETKKFSIQNNNNNNKQNTSKGTIVKWVLNLIFFLKKIVYYIWMEGSKVIQK
jgi:hypothetical protein